MCNNRRNVGEGKVWAKSAIKYYRYGKLALNDGSITCVENFHCENLLKWSWNFKSF